MKKYLVLFFAPNAETDKMMQDTTPEDADKMEKEWNDWMDTIKGSFVDQGAILGKNKRVTSNGISDTRNELTGYSVIQAESRDDAARLLLDSPHFQIPGAYIDVTEFVDMPGAGEAKSGEAGS